jgi:poly(3-hydroxybutyrate) depolymerase
LFLSCALGAQASDGRDLLKEPNGSFVFDASLGNPAPPITVWYYRPDKVEPDMRVVFLLHGSSRTGEEARDIGALYGNNNNFILLAPEFSEKNYPITIFPRRVTFSVVRQIRRWTEEKKTGLT